MKKYFLIAIGLLMLIPFAGCKKKGFDPASKTLQDFIGTWEGSITTFKENKLLKESGTVVIYSDPGGSTLSGIFFMKETRVFHEFQFVDGTFYFNVENNDPENPFCQRWSLSGFAVFSAEGKIDIRLTGNECGDIGGEFVNWTGTLNTRQVQTDSIRYYNFGGNNRKWGYKITLDDADSCTLEKTILSGGMDYYFAGMNVQTCNWTGMSAIKWTVTPAMFTIQLDSSVADKPVSFPISAKFGVTYHSYLAPDTVTVKKVDTAAIVVTPAGTFTCAKFEITEPVYRSNVKNIRTSWFWINNRAGIVRYEVANPVSPTDIGVMVLKEKNF
ncbi:MAG TPA: hypothetical protein PLK82_01765 [Bacteroidales bacterium]|nr:hypothetical protein [Bacteroidales bacterium]